MAEQSLDLLTFPLYDSRLIEASAGTGKTYTIAALYLRLILGHGGKEAFQRPLNPPEILVVTFTEAATQELRERIRTRLSEAAAAFLQHESRDPVLQQLIDSYQHGQHASCARQLELAAQWMDEAAISTIHGWCNRMLSEHAFASGSLFSQQLETDQSALQLQVCRDYWRTFYYSLSKTALQQVLSCWAQPDALWQAAAAVLSLYQDAEPQELTETPAELLHRIAAERELQLQQLKAPWLQWVDELKSLLLPAIEQKQVDGRKLQKRYVDNWLDKLQLWSHDSKAELLELATGWRRLTEEGIAEAWKGTPPQHPAFAAISQLEAGLQNLPHPKAALLQHAACWMRQRLSTEQQQRAIIGFDDMLHRLRRALTSEHGQELAEIIRRQFPVALIDEFQDTDPVQYQIFDAIYQLDKSDNSRGIFLIGDPKQAIYAFRGADIYTYLQAKAATAGRHYTLPKNFRSVAGMVSAVNQLFTAGEQQPQGAFLFRSGNAHPIPFFPVKAAGRDEQLRINQQVQPAMTLWHYPQPASPQQLEKPLSRQQYLQFFAHSCASEICRLLVSGSNNNAVLAGNKTSRSLQPADIAVLVNNRDEAAAIRQALQERAIRSVYLSDKESVFRSAQAPDLLLILKACAEPHQERAVHAALGCATLQQDIALLDQLTQDELKWEEVTEQFKTYQQRWQQYGVLPMLRSLLFDFKVPARLNATTGGERALTDMLHLAELLQQVSGQLDGEQALIRYLVEHIAGDGVLSADEQKVRLESDAELVQVITIHKSKGLEYGLVFMPFIASARPVKGDRLPVSYHDSQGNVRYSFTPTEEILVQAEHERLAEDIRKLYVGVTRAKYACWLGLAPLEGISAVVRLLFGCQPEPALFNEKLVTAWENSGEIQVMPAPQITDECFFVSPVTDMAEQARAPARYFREHWWIASYSALAQQTTIALAEQPADYLPEQEDTAEQAKDEQLAELLHEVLPAEQPAALSVQYRFMAGPEAGTFLHSILEWAAEQGFSKLAAEPALLSAELEQRFALRNWPVDSDVTLWLQQLLTTPLLLGAGIKEIALAQLKQYQAEMEFWFSCHKVNHQTLDLLLQQYIWPGQPRPLLGAGVLNGMLKGFIDLVFEYQGRFYVCDYKSNLLGSAAEDYLQPAMSQLMLEKRYELQAVLYCLALHRLLKQRLPGYSYQQHVGGAVHWFIRGYQAPSQGLVHMLPPEELIEQLDQLFRTGSPEQTSEQGGAMR